MNKSEMEQITQAQLEAYNRRDLSKFCDCYHDDVKVTNIVSGKVRCEGKEQFKEIYKNLFASSPHLHCELKNRIVLDHAVIDEEWVTGSSNYPNGIHIIAIYSFRDGVIDRVWFPI
jgi:hypothetical protein